MSKVKLYHGEREATFIEKLKGFLLVNGVILIFLFAFFIPMANGTAFTEDCDPSIDCEPGGDMFSVVIGYSFSGCFVIGLILVWYQAFLVVTGKAVMVMTSGNSSTIRRVGSNPNSTGGGMFSNLATKGMMRALDIDGDGKLSFDEAATFYFQDKEAPLKFVVPDFKKAYEIISRELDLPLGDLSISFDDYCVYTDSEDKAKFDKIDTDNDGMISKDQLIESIWNDGDSELEKVRAHFNDCNSDGDGFLSREEFEKFMIPPDESKSTEKTDEWWSGTEE
ncbi:MAG: EF-hand domain-containing protein [Candidatus Poseidoniales archaeon]